MTDRPLLYDVFCGAGGVTKGYQRAGFRVIGIDNRAQPHYCGDGFMQMDYAEFFMRYLAGEWERAEAFHTSPPCQGYSKAGVIHKKEHPKLIPQTRAALILTDRRYVIENVEGAPLRACIFLCGTMFGLDTRRHRWFESNVDLGFPPFACSCAGKAARGELLNYHNTQQRNLYLSHQNDSGSRAFKKSLGVEWMNFDESQEAIPPAYTEFIGARLLAALQVTP